MLLMVLTGELALEMNESRSVLARDEAEDEDRRNEVLILWGEKRAAIEWNREDCMVASEKWLI